MQVAPHRLIVIGGPTGSGKTKLALQLAAHFKCCILSADARQVFRELKIGSAAPSEEELKQAKHYFIADRSIEQPFNAGMFEQEALVILDKLYQENNTQIVCGGSGLYINALLNGMDEMPEIAAEIRETLNLRWKTEGLGALTSELKQKDAAFAAQVDLENPQRVIRALEVITATGLPYSSFRKKSKKVRNFEVTYFATDVKREELYRNINKRTLHMMENGWLAETEKLLPYKHLNALQTVGYKELFHYFEGKHSLDEAISLIQQNTRRYAKRQVTWLRNQTSVEWIHPEMDVVEMLKKMT